MFYLYRKAHKQGSIKKQAPTWGDSVRVTHRGTSAGCPLPACARLHRGQPTPGHAQNLSLTAHRWVGTWVQEAAHAVLPSPSGNP